MFAVLAVALVLERVPLPGGDSFGYASWARNLVIVALVGHALGATGLRMRRSPIGDALLAYTAAASLSVAVARGSFGDVRMLAAGVGVFFVARALGAPPRTPTVLLDWLGAVVVGIALRELVANPSILLLRETARTNLVTDHPNTLGFALAFLFPLFLGASANRKEGARAAFYAVAAGFVTAATYSRAAWIGIALGATAIAAASEASRRFAGTARRPLPAIATLLAFSLVAAAVLAVSMERGESDQQRLRIIETSLTLFREHWPFGVGFGTKNLERVFPSRYIELFGASLFLFHSHNLYVDALVGTGVVGLLAAGWLVLRLAATARRALLLPANALSRPAATSFAVALAVFLLLGLADMPFYHGRLTILIAVGLAYVELGIDSARAYVADGKASP
jgi:O-antigen ligase